MAMHGDDSTPVEADEEGEFEEGDSEDEETEDQLARKNAGRLTADSRYAEGTHKCYGSKWNNVKKFCKCVYPELLGEDGEPILPLSKEFLNGFFNHCELKSQPKTLSEVATSGSNGFVYTKDEKGNLQHNSFNHVSGHRDGIKHAYKLKGLQLEVEIEDMIKEKLQGYKRVVASKKNNGEMKSKEGKDPLNIEGLKYLSNAALKSEEDYFLSAKCHCYLLFCWCLIARSNTTADIVYESIGWCNDCLTILILKMKNDQTGANSFARSVYANPLSPSTCPILSFAILVFMRDIIKRTLDEYLEMVSKTDSQSG